MIGSRREDEAHYPVNEIAAKYDASVTEETDEPAEAYADWRREPWSRCRTPGRWTERQESSRISRCSAAER